MSAASQPSGVRISRSPTRSRTSPARSPASAAGDPGVTAVMRTSRLWPQRFGSAASTSTPTHARRTRPSASSSETTQRTRSIGIAKPSPSLPPLRVTIDEFTPITSPCAFTSGPPELPGLMDASVWIMSK
jgi:hypothetical protein